MDKLYLIKLHPDQVMDIVLQKEKKLKEIEGRVDKTLRELSLAIKARRADLSTMDFYPIDWVVDWLETIKKFLEEK